VEGTRRCELNASIDSTSQAIITVRGIDTDWSIVRAIGGWLTGLVLRKVSRVTTWGSSILSFLKNVIVTALRVVKAIADSPVRVFFNTRLWTVIDLSGIARLCPIGLISERTSKTCSYFDDIDKEDSDSGAYGAIGGAVTWQCNVMAYTVDWFTRWTWQRVIGGVSTSCTVTECWYLNGSVSGLSFSSTERASGLRPRGPWGHHTIHGATLFKAVLNISGVSGTVSTTIGSGSIDSSGSCLGGVSTGSGAVRPGAPFAIGTVNWGTSSTAWNGTVTSGNVTEIVLTAIGEGGTVLWGIDASTIAIVSSDVTEGDGTQVRRWTGHVGGQVLTTTANGLITVASLTDIGRVTVCSANPCAVVSARRIE
jgi:hypothetical protein